MPIYWLHPNQKPLIDLIKTHSFSIVSTEPTHHVISLNSPSHTTLDLFIVDYIENVIHFSKSASPFIAGHDFIHLIVNIDTSKAPPITIVCHNLNNLNQNRLHELLSSDLSPENYAPETVTAINRYVFGSIRNTQTNTQRLRYMYIYIYSLGIIYIFFLILIYI